MVELAAIGETEMGVGVEGVAGMADETGTVEQTHVASSRTVLALRTVGEVAERAHVQQTALVHEIGCGEQGWRVDCVTVDTLQTHQSSSAPDTVGGTGHAGEGQGFGEKGRTGKVTHPLRKHARHEHCGRVGIGALRATAVSKR